ncbi:hypothetical protein L6164_023988 [Bauhinia variegata]|uniref:Uncharacterized protein n=1 Tax=Bauhinia variegata TaxID=167791 RepID=A0ACB9LYG9_BAUVA|nr:hypothetical protein L6164_023988 [Bauhinia variegata]
MLAPLSVHMEKSNKGRVEESPTFDDVSLTHAKSTSSPQTAGQPQELVQNPRMNEPLLVVEDQALEQKKVSTSSQLSFSARVPLLIPIPSPTSLYFSNTSNAERDHILSGIDLNKQPMECVEAIEQSSTSGLLVLLQNPSPQTDRRRIEEDPTTDANLATSTKAKTTGSLLDLPQGQNRINQTMSYNREDTKVEPIINLQAFEGTDLVDLFQSMEEDDDVQASIPSTPLISANIPDVEVKLMALADLQISQKMPLENIACSEAESLRLENALNFLSSHSCADGAMSDRLKAAIDSLHQEFHSILSSFRQASATILRFTLLEEKEKTIKEKLPRRKESAIALMNELQQNDVSVMEQISKLQDKLSSLQEQKKKCIADTIRFKSEFESVKNNKAQMLEDHIKSREELFKRTVGDDNNGDGVPKLVSSSSATVYGYTSQRGDSLTEEELEDMTAEVLEVENESA